MRISDWSSDVCSSDLGVGPARFLLDLGDHFHRADLGRARHRPAGKERRKHIDGGSALAQPRGDGRRHLMDGGIGLYVEEALRLDAAHSRDPRQRSEEPTSELQSLMRISYAVFCLKKKQKHT